MSHLFQEDLPGLEGYHPDLKDLRPLNVGAGGIPLDGGWGPVAARMAYDLSVLRDPRTWEQRVELNGVSVSLYTAYLAGLLRSVHEKNLAEDLSLDAVKREVLMAMGAQTSSGLMRAPKDSDQYLIHGIQIPPLFSKEELQRFRPTVDCMDNEPVSITVPGASSIDAVNDYLREEHPGYEVYFDITTSSCSTIAANFFTGGLGDNRLGLDVAELTVVYPEGSVATIHDPKEIEALRGTQGYACVGTEFKLNLKKVPQREEQIILDLSGNTHELAYGEAFPQLLSLLAPYCVNRGPEDIWVDGIEIIDSTGLKTILRPLKKEDKPEGLAKMADDLLKELGDKSVGSVMLRVRHNRNGTLEEAARYGDQAAQAFFSLLDDLATPEEQLIRLVLKYFSEEALENSSKEDLLNEIDGLSSDDQFLSDLGADVDRFQELKNKIQQRNPSLDGVRHSILQRIRFVTKPAAIAQVRALRAEVPEQRRKEAGTGLASGSNDRDVKFKIIKSPEGKAPSVEDIQAGVREATRAVMGVFLKIAKKAEEANCYAIWNGHLNFLSPDFSHLDYYDGGGNLHLAITGKDDSVEKPTVEGLLLELSQELSKLHNRVFGVIRLEINEGEKHYPLGSSKKSLHEFLHFVRTREELAVARMVAILKDQKARTLNFRAPDFESALKGNGLSDVWEKVQVQLTSLSS